MSAQVTQDIARAAAALARGSLVAFPTETVYGLGAHALDPVAVARIFEAKERPSFDPLIVHVADVGSVERLVLEFPSAARALAERFWPGPLTMVLPKTAVVPDIVTAGLPTVGVRVPDHPVALQLLGSAKIPIAAPSANLFGRVSPTTAGHVAEQLSDRIELILDGGPCRVGVESTVVLLTESPPVLLRPGGVPLEELEAVIGQIRIATPSHREDAAQLAPGQLAQHYSPSTPVMLIDDWSRAPCGADVAAIAFEPLEEPSRFGSVEVLSKRGDLCEAAARLFAALHDLDRVGARTIVAKLLPEQGLGRAINDRLRRAAAIGMATDQKPGS